MNAIDNANEEQEKMCRIVSDILTLDGILNKIRNIGLMTYIAIGVEGKEFLAVYVRDDQKIHVRLGYDYRYLLDTELLVPTTFEADLANPAVFDLLTTYIKKKLKLVKK